jgi:hypothetical protein
MKQPAPFCKKRGWPKHNQKNCYFVLEPELLIPSALAITL